MSDTTDIIKRLEECFHMSFDGKESEKLLTIEEVTDYIWKKLGQPNNVEKCISQMLFYRIRKALAVIYSIDEKAITVNTPLKKLGNRRVLSAGWTALEKESNLTFPRINRCFFGTWGAVYISETIGELTIKVLEQNSASIFQSFGLAKTDIYGMVRWIVCDIAGVPKEKVKANTRIVADLGLD